MTWMVRYCVMNWSFIMITLPTRQLLQIWTETTDCVGADDCYPFGLTFNNWKKEG
jgi:hypothetical protein